MQSFKIIPGPSDWDINQLFAKSLLDFLYRKMIINQAATGGDNDSKTHINVMRIPVFMYVKTTNATRLKSEISFKD